MGLIPKIKYRLYVLKNKLMMFLNLIEWIKIYQLKKDKRLFHLKDLVEVFKDQSVFAFATGGSVDNIGDKNLKKLENKNIMITTTGIVQYYLKYGVLPNIWMVHNPETVIQVSDMIEQKGLELDFSKTFIFVPSNFSNSKNCYFSSPAFRKFRRVINDTGVYVLYNENIEPYPPENPPKNYLESIEPIEVISGSGVESLFLPWLSFIGVKNIFFSGVDHMDTGHFWDRSEYYQDVKGNPLDFQKIRPNELVYMCGEIARDKCKEKGIKVYRLEKVETVLQDYPYIDFSEAYNIASNKILPKDIKW